MIYLDNAATTRRKPASVYLSTFTHAINGGNAGRGANKLSLGGVNTIVTAQDKIAELFSVPDAGNIIFTHNATYALNMAILGVLEKGDHVVATAMDHNSVLRPVNLHGNFSVANADKKGFVSPLAVRQAIKNNTKLIICTHVSNVCGTIEPIQEIARIAREKGALFLLDASQSAGSVPINMLNIGADIIACPGHKGLMGPMGTGILCIKDPDRVKAIIVGGTGSMSESPFQPMSMPEKFHSGTINTPAIAGLTKGVEFILKEGVKSIGSHEYFLNSALRSELKNMKNISVYGTGETGITAFNIEGLGSEDTAARLGEDIIVRAGYHCAPLAHKALGTGKTGAVRISFGYFNTLSHVRKVTDIIYKISKSIT